MTVLDLVSLASFVETMKVGSSDLGFIVVFQNLVVTACCFQHRLLYLRRETFSLIWVICTAGRLMFPRFNWLVWRPVVHSRGMSARNIVVLLKDWRSLFFIMNGLKVKLCPFGLHCCRRLSRTFMYSRVFCG